MSSVIRSARLIAQHIAARHSDRVASLTLFGPILEPQETARERLRERAATARNEGMSDRSPTSYRVPRSRARPQTRIPSSVAFVRESHMRQDAEGFARSCEAPGASRASRSPAHRLSNPYRHRRRGCRRARPASLTSSPTRSVVLKPSSFIAAAIGRRSKNRRSAAHCSRNSCVEFRSDEDRARR